MAALAVTKPEESLLDQLERIYNSLDGLEFEAYYENRGQMQSTGQYRDVLKVIGTSTKANNALEKICANLDNETFQGEKLSSIMWTGITGKKYFGYKIWVRVYPQGIGEYDIQNYCEIGKQYKFKLTTPSVDIFSEVDWKVPGYKAGVNIHAEVATGPDSSPNTSY